jgi:class 3 adenylate cyclase
MPSIAADYNSVISKASTGNSSDQNLNDTIGLSVGAVQEIFANASKDINELMQGAGLTNLFGDSHLGDMSLSDIVYLLIVLALIIIIIIIILAAISFILSLITGAGRLLLNALNIEYGHAEGMKISTIMFIDMKGFSSEVEKDENTALRKLWKHEEIMKRIIKKQGGRVVKTIGDAIMCDFDSTLSAVKAAMIIQSILIHDHFRVRIGMHVDEMIHKKGDVYGSGVNIASRIESISEPGEIYISEEVYNQVKGHIPAEFEDLGLKQLKNIQTPVRVYKIVLTHNLIYKYIKLKDEE